MTPSQGGAGAGKSPAEAPACPVVEWAASGCMALTGHPGGPPLAPGAPVLSRLRSVARLIRTLSGRLGRPVDLDVPAVLVARAAELGLRRGGTTSANGQCRLLAAQAGTASGQVGAGTPAWWALNLARPEDVDAVPAALAGLGIPPAADPWDALQAAGAVAGRDELVERCRLLGMPAAPVAALTTGRGWPPWACSRLAPPTGQARRGARVVDLSALWAGPVCGWVLSQAGLEVTKVEAPDRPDAMRWGSPGLYAQLHAGQEVLPVDVATAPGRDRLRRLLEEADVVIEGSRGRALDQLGLGPGTVPLRPGAVWLTITGYGRGSAWTAFGDDAAVAGGLVAWDGGIPAFCGDAMGDPISGMVGALAVLTSLAAGGGHHLDLAMRDAVGAVAAPVPEPAGDHTRCRAHPLPGGRWQARCERYGVETPVRSPSEVSGTRLARSAR